MKRNAILPYIMIMVLGIGLMFGLGFKGLNDAKKLANSDAEEGDTVESSGEVASGPEAIYADNCVACHGDQYQGTVGPKLTNLSLAADEIKAILADGKGSMPGNLVPDDQLDEMTEWLLELK